LLALGNACGGGDDGTGTGGQSGTTAMGSGGSSMFGTGGSSAGQGHAGTGGSAGSAATTASGGTGALGGSGASSGTGGTPPMGTGGASGMGPAGTGGSAGVATGGTAGTFAQGGRNGGGRGGMGAGGMQTSSGGTGMVSSGGFTIDVQLASAVKSTAPTTVGIVTWSLDKPGITSAHIDFGLDTTYGMTAPVDLTIDKYRTLLLGMKPMKTYHFRVVASDGTQMYTSDDKTVMTGAKTTLVNITAPSVKNAAKVEKGFMVSSFWQGSGSSVPFIMDSDGEVVWWYVKGSSESSDGISRARMSADGKNIWLVNETLSGAPLRRVSMDTLDEQTYSATKASHDICAVTGDTMAYLDYSESDCNSIFEITPASTDKGKEIFESTGVTGMSGSITSCHGNAVRYSKKENLYTYSDWQQDVAVVDRTGTLKWKLSQKVSGGHSAWGGKQHGHQLLDSSILIFANDANGANKSAAFEFGLDGSLIKEFNSGGSATNFGDVQRLPSGNTLITYSTSSLIQEVDSSDSVVVEIKGAGSFGYVEFRPSLYGEPIDSQ
jgi:hypothetical protein